MSYIVGVALLAVVTAVACALPGVFVVLRKESMLVDAISHAVLPGLVVGYAITHSLDSPLLVVGAALGGLAVVLGSEYLRRTRLLAGDASQGLIFPALFSVGVIMVSQSFGSVHLDTHAVLVGDLNLAAFAQLQVGGVNLGPQYLYVMLGVLVINALFIWALLPKLQVATFDPTAAAVLGIRVPLLNTALMFLVAVTVTAAFNAAGAVLVLALVVVPAASAHLITQQLRPLLFWTVVIAALGALGGFGVAYLVNAATSAAMAVSYGLGFLGILLFRHKSHRAA